MFLVLDTKGMVFISKPSHIKSLLTSCFLFQAHNVIARVLADVKATTSHIVGK
jgi:hypothetical protein